MQYDKINTNINTNESRHSEMGPVRENPIQSTVRTADLTSVHNTTQNSSDNLPSYLQTITIAQMLSIRGEEPMNGMTKKTTNGMTTMTNEMIMFVGQ